MIDKADTYCGKCIKADVCGMEGVYDPATTYCLFAYGKNKECILSRTNRYDTPYRWRLEERREWENRK